MIPFRAALIDAPELAALRREFRDWLRRARVDTECADRLVLAVHEAAADAVLHAVRMNVVAVAADVDGDIVSISVEDQRRWKNPIAHRSPDGGFTLMPALLEEVTIQTGASGTIVRMRQRVRLTV